MAVYEIDKDGNEVELHRTQPSLEAAEAAELREKQKQAEFVEALAEKFQMEGFKKKPSLNNLVQIEKYKLLSKVQLDKAWKQYQSLLKKQEL